MKALRIILSALFVVAGLAYVNSIIPTPSAQATTIIRDCQYNSIDNAGYPHAGMCGAADPTELIQDIQHNVPNDLQTIYADGNFGLTQAEYTDFQNHALPGTIYRDGHITVGNDTVWTGVWTMGRTTLNGVQRSQINIGGHIYYYSAPQYSFGPDSMPVMVLFDDNGVVRTAIMNDCGNPVGGGTKVRPSVTCNKLNDTQDQTNPNKHTFTANATLGPNTTLNKIVYTITTNGQTITKETHSYTEPVDYTFTHDGNVSATIYADVPGGHTIQSVPVDSCKTAITFHNTEHHLACVNMACVSVAGAGSNQCTTDNNCKPPHLTVVKVVNNNHGGTKQASDFTLRVNSTQVTTGVANTENPGDYTVSEDTMNGYHQVSITGDCDASGHVHLNNGDNKTCVIENEDNGTNVCQMPTCNTNISGCSYPYPDTTTCSCGPLVCVTQTPSQPNITVNVNQSQSQNQQQQQQQSQQQEVLAASVAPAATTSELPKTGAGAEVLLSLFGLLPLGWKLRKFA